jgi:hypothetical protein
VGGGGYPELPLTGGLDALHGADAVHVALYEVPVDAVADAQGAFEVDGVADAQGLQAGVSPGFRNDVKAAGLGVPLGEGEAGAVDGDAGSEREVGKQVAGGDFQPVGGRAGGVRLRTAQAFNPANGFYDSGEHR